MAKTKAFWGGGWSRGLLILVAACGSEDSASSDAWVLDIAPDVDATVDLGTVCENNTDCGGGEVCREGYCRESCGDAEPCDGALGVCDEMVGYCVGCLDDNDCEDNEACDDTRCGFFCREDDACGADEFCEFESGECRERVCETSVDCAGGYRCDHFSCVPIDAIVCEADAVTCADDRRSIVRCSGDGTSQHTEECGPDSICEVTSAGVACADIVCEPNELGCVDDATAYLCNAGGTAIAELPCADDQYCESGNCLLRVCEPSSVACEGQSIVECDAIGASETVTACASTAACAGAPLGCSCVEDTCIERDCTPGTSRCAGGRVQACAADGIGYLEPTACEADELCVAGECLAIVCTAGSRECAGDTLVVCNADGRTRTETNCADTDRICTGSAAEASCTTRVCAPDVQACNGPATAVVACDSRGAAQTTTPCATDEYCSSGVCLERACAPDSRVCDGTRLIVCNGLGSTSTITNCAVGLGCAAGACVVGCGDGGLQPGEECDDGNLQNNDGCDENCRREPLADFVRIPAGTFTMGSPTGEVGRQSDETQHLVTITRDFYIAATEVTQGEWKALSGSINPSSFSACGDLCPVERVDWFSVLAYANVLSVRDGLTPCYSLPGCTDAANGWKDGTHSGCTGASFIGLSCPGYRLPTESEWEYAARAGTTTATYGGDLDEESGCVTLGGSVGFESGTLLADLAWYDCNSEAQTHPQATLRPNAWGLYDMLGNVAEWAWDGAVGYPGAVTDPTGPAIVDGWWDSSRVVRGGSFSDPAWSVRGTDRDGAASTDRANNVGFRLARTVP
jgi:cysteine-rich repeat protein